MSENSNENFNDRLDKVFSVLDADPSISDEQNTDTVNANDPASVGDTKPSEKNAIGEDQLKTNDADKDKPAEDKTPLAIDPPVSWPSDDKEAFKSLPTWAQERIVNRENEREAHFSERARTIAAREQEMNTLQTRTQQQQEQYASELQRLNQLATQLMPAKFSDINSEADYLRLKVEDPARASEYEAFTQVLGNAQRQHAQVLEAQQKQHLDSQWAQLQNKYPEFKDPQKGPAMLDEVRKAAVDYYGYSPAEVSVIADHRQVAIVRDAIAWRNHLGNLKAAEGKRVPSTPNTPKLQANGAAAGANLSAEQKNKVLNRAASENDLRRKADILASLI
jgi:hypothetical protein